MSSPTNTSTTVEHRLLDLSEIHQLLDDLEAAGRLTEWTGFCETVELRLQQLSN